MSRSFSQSIQSPCPQCGQPVDLEIWLIVDTAERPDLAERIRQNTLHDAPCPHCGHTGQVDAPLLLYRPGEAPPLIFSPAQNTNQEQDREHAAGLVGTLREQLGAEWRDEWVAEGLPGVPRALLSAALADDPQAALAELERLLAADNEIRLPDGSEADLPEAQPLAEKLVAWIQQDTLDEAQAYLGQHATELLTDEAVAVMQRLVQVNPHNPNVRDHQARLARAREMGIAAMYAEIRRQRLLERIGAALHQAGPIGAAVWQFIQAPDDAAAAALLRTEAALLLTLDAGQLLDQVLRAVLESGDEGLTTRLQARYQQWQTACQSRAGRPLRPVPEEPPPSRQARPESWQERAEQQAIQAERGSQYTVINAHQCAIGDNALVINQVGRLPLRWQRPAEGRPRLARAAVGREPELAELHGRLLAGQNTALVSRGTSAALRGQPAIGKTTLAAMYVDRFGSHYPGGVLWLEVGPDRRTADSVTPILQRIATYAYAADVQAQTLLENTVFAPDVVRALLSGHGALLVVIDDVWDPAVLRELQDALPDDAFVLLTTRDYHVAYALEESEAAIQRLDVLSQADARRLLQKGAAGLSDELADRVAAGLGRHALALTLAAGALAFRRAQRYEQTAAELLRRVAAGQGFGDLPRMDQAERQTAVEIALKNSYDELGQAEGGAQRQAWFRSLGVFAQEADFDAAAAAAVWGLEVPVAEEFLLLLDGLGLLQETGAYGTAGSRWRQHVILRAYALSLQTTQERIHFSERHADYYLALTQSCYESKPRDYDRVEQEFAQIQHTFAWCERNSPRRAMRLALLLDDFMRNRGRVALLSHWLKTALQGAEAHGDRLGKANTLQSLGDLERRLGNIEQARQHYDAALPLYEAEQDPFGKMNTWISLARLEAGLGHSSEAEQYYQRTFALAEQVHFADHPVVLGWRQECAALAQTTARSPGEMSELQALADQLIAWIQTPDWADSEAYLQQHAADLLSDEAEAVLASLQQTNPDHPAIPQHLALLRRCRVIGIAPAYQEFHAAQAAAQQAAQDPAAQALIALLQVDSAEALEQALAQHPALLELPTLEGLAVLVAGAQETGQPEAARHLLALLGILLERYNHAHTEQVDLAEQTRFVALHETLLPLAETLDDELAAGLRRSLAWALNTLGNAHAEGGDHAVAVEAYTRAIAHAPDEAMLYRNRAAEHIEMKQWAQAEADIEQAAALEPDAPRLIDLRQALARHQSEG